MLDPHLAGHLDFTPAAAIRDLPGLPPGRHWLGLFPERDALLVVPEGHDASVPTPLMVLFHGGGGHAEKILPMMEAHAQARGFLLLVPQSLFPTWDIVIAGNGPDRERLDTALAAVAARHALDPAHLCFAGHSDGGSYALSLGLTNGQFVTHLIVSSAGFMTVQKQAGAPRIFLSHGVNDEQIPIARSGRAHAALLKEAGYDVTYMEYNGPHAYQPPIVSLAVDFFLAPQSVRRNGPV
ncbi:alpha/beta hydrolase [Aquabacter spiritensis]|uniref:Putative esterase n=1 Tax=Aquabacter spiritensis TaxID=933073 RepID=A0A4R3LPS2_9HYPH|nr:esterase [Aquabacter spiritensis]TCT02181.1 putative esterase [Aquabacter spiritensis]